ncbi:MAG TPA: hypothetical protein VJ352_14810, partial [Geodermatophilus sp.]|nr:hypothetical protein [Geodermatophilus sp.]
AVAAAVDAQAVVCPVAVRHAGDVVEVHLPPALQPGADARALAALAEYAVAHVLEDGAPAAPADRPPRRRRTVRALSGYGRARP